MVTPDNKVAAKGVGTVANRAGEYGFVRCAYDRLGRRGGMPGDWCRRDGGRVGPVQVVDDEHGRARRRRCRRPAGLRRYCSSEPVWLASSASGSPSALASQLATDCAEALGESHQATLEARHAQARWTASAGNHTAAAQLYGALRSDLAQLLDDNHWLAQQCRAEHAELQQQAPDLRQSP